MREELIEFKERYRKPPLIGYLPALYPDSIQAEAFVNLAYRSGLRFIETGLPTDNPYLDGEIIRSAMKKLSCPEMRPGDFMVTSGRIIKKTGMGCIAMLYEGTLNEYGITDILNEAAETGIDALLVPNISSEKRAELYSEAKGGSVEIVNFIGFDDSADKIEEVAAQTTGFLYFQSTNGSTGGQFVAGEEAVSRLARVKEIASAYQLPVALGFGINGPEDACSAAEIGADAVIVGTAFVRAVQSGKNEFLNFIQGFSEFLAEGE